MSKDLHTKIEDINSHRIMDVPMLYSTLSNLVLSAAKNGNEDVMKQFAGKNIDKDLMDEALFCAAMHGREDFVKLCISMGADPNFWDSIQDETVLSVACREGHPNVVASLLESGSSVNAQSYGQRHAAIHSCAIGGSVKCLHLLLAAKADVNRKDCLGNTALIQACIQGKDVIVRELIHAGAKPEATNIRQRDAFSLAMDRGEAGCVREILSVHPELANKRGVRDGLYPLTRAIRNRQEPIIKAFIDSGCSVNCPEATLLRPIHLAIEIGDVSLVQTLAEGGADVNSPFLIMPAGATPLMLAVAKGQTEIVNVLARTVHNLDSFDSVGRTALFMATKFSYPGCMKALLEAGANPDAYSWNINEEVPDTIPALPALHAAVAYDRQDEAGMLIQTGCDVNLSALYKGSDRHVNWWTPMEIAHDVASMWAMKLILAVGSKCISPAEEAAKTDQELQRVVAKAKWLLTNPDTLKNICRKYIRGYLRRTLWLNVQQLPLPLAMQEFLMLEDLIPE